MQPCKYRLLFLVILPNHCGHLMSMLPYCDFREMPLHAEVHNTLRVPFHRVDVARKVGVEAEVIVALCANVVEWYARIQQRL